MSDNLQKYLIMSVSILILSLGITATVFIVRTGRFTFNDYFTRFRVLLGSRQGPDFTEFDGQYVDGKRVRSIIEKYGGEYFIRVATKAYPVSFSVYNKPSSGFLNTGDGSYENYTKSDSKYYVNENSLFYTTLVYSNGANGISTDEANEIETGAGSKTVIGVYFEEKDSGYLSSDLKKEFKKGTIKESKEAYVDKLQSELEFLIQNNSSIKNWRQDLANSVMDVVAINETIGLPVTQDDGNIKNLQDDVATLKESLAKMWQTYINQYASSIGGVDKSLVSHAEIIREDSINNEDQFSLEYWINAYLHPDGGQNSTSEPETDDEPDDLFDNADENGEWSQENYDDN